MVEIWERRGHKLEIEPVHFVSDMVNRKEALPYNTTVWEHVQFDMAIRAICSWNGE